jgi:hypothetical protein
MYQDSTQYITGAQGQVSPSWSFPEYHSSSSETDFSSPESLNLFMFNVSPLDIPCSSPNMTDSDNPFLARASIDRGDSNRFLLPAPALKLPSTSRVLPTHESTHKNGKDCANRPIAKLRSRVSAFVRKPWAKQDQNTEAKQSHAALENQDTNAARPANKRRLSPSPERHEDRESKRARQAAGPKWYCAGGVMIYGEEEGC